MINKKIFISKFLIEKKIDMKKNNYALILAAKNGNLEKVRYLVKKGADINAENNESLRWSAINGHLEVVKYLIKKGADINAENNYALKWSSYYGHLEVVKYLLKKGADIKEAIINYNNFSIEKKIRILKNILLEIEDKKTATEIRKFLLINS